MTTPSLHASRQTKTTAIGEVPVDWEVRHLSDDIKLISGQHIDAEFCSTDASLTPYLTGPADFVGGKPCATRFVVAPKVVCQAGDILVTVKGSGTGTIVIADRPYCISRQLMAIRPKTWDRDFLYYVVSSSAERYNDRAVGLIPGIGREDILMTRVALPPLPEQRRIAAALGRWDLAINRQEQLLTAKVQFKRALMQQLLSGKRQFPEFNGSQWTKMKLGQFTRLAQRVVKKPDKSFKALGIRSHCKGTFLKRDFDPAAIEMTELFEVRKDDLIVNITFAWEGAIAIVGDADDGALVSHRFPTYVFNKDLVTPEYFRYVIVQRPFVLKLGLISPGGAGRNRVLSKRDFAKIEVLIPPLQEQQRIAAVLNSCDREIQLLEAELTAFKDQKRGLMQKLLTGEVRIRA